VTGERLPERATSLPNAPAAAPPAGMEFEPLERLLAVVGGPIGRSALLALAKAVRLPPPDRATSWTGETLAAQLTNLERRGRVSRVAGGVQSPDTMRFGAFRAAALGPDLRAWARILLEHFAGPLPSPGVPIANRLAMRWRYGSAPGEFVIAAMRVALCGGLPHKEATGVMQALDNLLQATTWQAAFAQPFDADVIARIEVPLLREFVVERVLAVALHRPQPSSAAVVDWSAARVASKDLAYAPLRLRAIEHRLWQGDSSAAEALLGAERQGYALGLLAASRAMQDDFSAALEQFAAADAALRKAGLAPRGALPLPIVWLRWRALMEGDDAAQAEAACKLCRAEARKAGMDRWLWQWLADVAACRLGERTPAELPTPALGRDALIDLVTAEGMQALGRRPDKAGIAILERTAGQFDAAGYAWPARRLQQLLAGFGDDGQGAAAWRHALKAMQRIGTGADASANRVGAAGDDGPTQRLGWLLHVDDYALRIEPCVQKRGPRGWGRSRVVSLASVMRDERLEAQDVQVCRAVLHHGGNAFSIDAGRALPALIGHPRVLLAPDLDTPVELVAAAPVVEVQRTATGVRLRIAAEIRDAARTPVRSAGAEVDPVLLRRESPTRVRVMRLTSVHRRLAQLIGKGLDVPTEGLAELDGALQQLAGSFEVHSEVDSNVEEVPVDRLLRAELSPQGAGLRLRLAVRPFGADGPRFLPGAGGSQVLAALGATRRRTVRDLRDERAAVSALLERAPMLEPASGFEWTIDDPAACLELVETLQGLPERVVTEWPAGKTLRVTRPQQVADLRVSVAAGGRDWFHASGGLKLDDGAVLELQRLIDLARAHAGRYLPLGDGGFVTLGEDLRRRVDELARLAERDAQGARFPVLAAEAVGESLDGAVLLDTGQWWEGHRARFEAAQALEPAVPSTLQAELRPYQVEGFRWLARLAAWGAGACLADDMGLGKTLQALALLLHRAAGGPALVVAPTSVVPNWLQEAQRFAPTLRLREFRGPGRAALIDGAGPFDVLVGSYTLVQQEVEAVGARPWHTLILDEAQQVKNATTKRAQAVLALDADFRVATTGTPVENRLDELWMLFRFLNPGLLGTRERFNERFATPIERRNDAPARVQLRRLVRPFVLRRVKSEVLPDLPPRTEITLTVQPEPAEAAFHEALRRSALEQLAREDLPPVQRRFRALAELMRLRRACCDPTIVAPNAELRGAKLETFAELATELAAGRHKALVFSQFTDFLDRLGARLESLQLRYQRLDGSTPAAERTRRIDAFQAGDGDFFLISLKAGGFGLNLTAADYVILADPWWNPAAEDQAAARAWRLGQGRPVTVYRLVLAGSIEERILALHRDKRALAEGLFGGEEFGSVLSAEQMLELLRDSADARTA